jgi:glycosyltransferase involved in cell wall biosynthesis
VVAHRTPRLPTVGPVSAQLSVIVPCYNVADHVLTTLQSLRRNAAPGIEILLVDDASTDATPELLAARVDQVPGARIVTAERNRGLSATRNLGLEQASGDYLTFVDGDDFLAPGYLSELLATIRRLNCDLVRTDHVQVRGRRRTVHRVGHGPRGVVMRPRDAILPVQRPTSVDAPNAWSGIYARRLLDAGLLRFDETLRTCEDRPWNWRLHLEADSFAVVGLTGVFYRRDVASSLTRVVDERQLDFLPAHDRIIDLVQADPEVERFLPKAVRSYCAIICHHIGRAARWPPALAEELRVRCGAALRRLPAGLVEETSAQMGGERPRLLQDLRAAA